MTTLLRPERRDRAERRARYTQLREEIGLSIDEAAARLHVSRRSAERYEARTRKERGIPSPCRPVAWMRDPILAHMQRYPHLEFSSVDFARVIAGTPTAWDTALTGVNRLVEEGLAEMVVDTSGKRPVRRYRLATSQGQEAA